MVIAHLVQHGELVSLPVGDNQRYDPSLDKKGDRILHKAYPGGWAFVVVVAGAWR